MTAPVPVRSPLPDALSGSTVVLVGGTSGIGLAAGALLRSVGARVVLVGRDPDRLKAAVTLLQDDGPADAVLGVPGDMGDEETLAAAFDAAGGADHVLITAGQIRGAGLLSGMSADTVHDAAAARLWSALAGAKAAARVLPPGGSITFSSGLLVARPLPGMSAMLAAIGGVEALTQALAVELAPARLRVNTVRFGRIDTPLVRSLPGHGTDEEIAAAGAANLLGRIGTAEEAAATAVFLMANNYMTGQVITVDGGETLT